MDVDTPVPLNLDLTHEYTPFLAVHPETITTLHAHIDTLQRVNGTLSARLEEVLKRLHDVETTYRPDNLENIRATTDKGKGPMRDEFIHPGTPMSIDVEIDSGSFAMRESMSFDGSYIADLDEAMVQNARTVRVDRVVTQQDLEMAEEHIFEDGREVPQQRNVEDAGNFAVPHDTYQNTIAPPRLADQFF